MRKEYAKLRRRPFLTPVWLSASGALVLFVALAWAVLSVSTTTVFVLRHAETASGQGEDPPLSPAGELRAARLREIFGQAGADLAIDGIVVSEFRRSQETARPLANALGIPVVVVASSDPGAVARRALAEFRGKRVMIIGHSNTVPAIVESLSGQQVPPMGETDFGTAYVVARPRFSPASVSVLRLP
jgi:broad specificity phosphatase PhoE